MQEVGLDYLIAPFSLKTRLHKGFLCLVDCCFFLFCPADLNVYPK